MPDAILKPAVEVIRVGEIYGVEGDPAPLPEPCIPLGRNILLSWVSERLALLPRRRMAGDSDAPPLGLR
jgi:hypothetical protein